MLSGVRVFLPMAASGFGSVFRGCCRIVAERRCPIVSRCGVVVYSARACAQCLRAFGVLVGAVESCLRFVGCVGRAGGCGMVQGVTVFVVSWVTTGFHELSRATWRHELVCVWCRQCCLRSSKFAGNMVGRGWSIGACEGARAAWSRKVVTSEVGVAIIRSPCASRLRWGW